MDDDFEECLKAKEEARDLRMSEAELIFAQEEKVGGAVAAVVAVEVVVVVKAETVSTADTAASGDNFEPPISAAGEETETWADPTADTFF